MFHRRSIRLQHYDYSQAGAYFVTICVHARECLLGEIVKDEMILNEYGKIVEDEWLKSAEMRKEIDLDTFVIMPNHLHGIVVINKGDDLDEGAHGRAPLLNRPHLYRKPRSLGSFIAGFKSAATRRLNILRHTPSFAVWQRNYYEQIIRDETHLNHVRQYIQYNPARWTKDENNPLGVK